MSNNQQEIKEYQLSLTEAELEIIIKSIECAGYYKAMSANTAIGAGNIIEKIKKIKSN